MLSVTFFSDSESEPENALILSFSVSLLVLDSGFLKNFVSNTMHEMQKQKKVYIFLCVQRSMVLLYILQNILLSHFLYFIFPCRQD